VFGRLSTERSDTVVRELWSEGYQQAVEQPDTLRELKVMTPSANRYDIFSPTTERAFADMQRLSDYCNRRQAAAFHSELCRF
jgi:hypothetical protein